MKLPALGFCALLLAGAVGLDRGRSDDGKTNNETTTIVGLAHNAGDAINLAEFAEEVAVVERELANVTELSRADSLVTFGRTHMASGRFALAAAAYAMFLSEFGTEHPYSARVAMRYADCLFPFDYSRIDVLHMRSGPELRPTWRMSFTPKPAHLTRAILAFELAASITNDQQTTGAALLKLGWVHRALNDWGASTKAWDRCSKESATTKFAADALWLATENLAWTEQPAAAVARLRQFKTEHSGDSRAKAIPTRIEHLQAEAKRAPGWRSDPVASLKTEIKARSAARSPSEIYRSVIKWLGRRGDRATILTVSRWACAQDDWPVNARTACRHDLVNALLLTAATDLNRRAAAKLLGEIVSITSNNDAAVPAGLRRFRLLIGLGLFDEAERAADELAARVKGSRRWEPVVLTQRIEFLLERGERDLAKSTLDLLVKAHPDYDVHERFGAAFARMNEEDSK